MMRSATGPTARLVTRAGVAASEGIVERRGRAWGRVLGRLVLFVAALGLGLGVVVGGLAVYHEGGTGRILPGISIDGLDVGGLTPAEAHAAVAEHLAPLSSGAVSVRSGLGTYRVAFADVGRGADVDAMVEEAAALGRGGTWLDETLASIRLRLEPRDVALRLTYDHDKAAAALARFADRMTLGPVDAKVASIASGFEVGRGVDGHALDVEAAVAAVDAAMRDRGTPDGAVIKASVRSVVPKLTDDMVQAAITRANAMAADLKVSVGKQTWKLAAAKIRSWITFGWQDGVYGPQIDRAKIPDALKKIAKTVSRPVRDAAFLRDKHGRIVGSMADRAGQKLDVAASAEAIASTIEARAEAADPAPVELAMTVLAPKLTAAEAAKKAPLMVKVGGWTTYYQVSAHNGFGANITVPTRVLNGTVVQPGAVFDFWDALGEVSLRTGYKMGGAIIGGHSVEGKALAGGICAASTTLFNAALRGGFDILARQPHWYYITRYPLGLDATVSNTQTMRFRNDTVYPILIRGFASPGVVRYEIWSVPNGRTVTLSRPSVSNVVPGYDTTVKTSALPAGTSERTEWPVDGKDVVVTRTVKDGHGRVIHRDTFVSHYHRMVGINRIGVG
jgi:vancomycin resistance protein YoaR